MKVVVVGAGTAGLAAVHTLQKAGVDVVAFEAADHAGGRIAGARQDGFTLDLGAQFFFRFYDTTFALCRELGLADDILPFPLRMAILRDGRLHPAVASLDPRVLWQARGDLLRFRGLGADGMAQAARLLPLMLRRRRDLHFIDYGNLLDLDDESLAAFAARRCGEEALEYLFQPVASSMTLGAPEEIGAGYGLALLRYTLGGLFTLRHGIGSLAERLHAACADRVRLSTPVRRIVIGEGRVRGVETADGLVAADAVVCATTATQALALTPALPPEIRGPLSRATYSACCHVMFGVQGNPLPAGCYGIGLPRRSGSPLAGITDNALKCAAYAPPGMGLLHGFTWGAHARALNGRGDAEVLAGLQAEVRRQVPAMPVPLFARLHRWDEAVCLAPPGMLRAMHGLKRDHCRAVDGFFLAGEYLNMPSVDGALQSGIAAARAVLRG